jgi:hypothetical protein
MRGGERMTGLRRPELLVNSGRTRLAVACGQCYLEIGSRKWLEVFGGAQHQNR